MVSACMRTPSVPSVSALMAPTQVGAVWRPAGSTWSPEMRNVSIWPSSRRNTPGGASPCSATISPGGATRRCVTASQSASCVVVQVVEEVDRPQLAERQRGGPAHASARYWWISETAIEPSPTALATRLKERARTSPATSTPGTVVSSR